MTATPTREMPAPGAVSWRAAAMAFSAMIERQDKKVTRLAMTAMTSSVTAARASVCARSAAMVSKTTVKPVMTAMRSGAMVAIMLVV